MFEFFCLDEKTKLNELLYSPLFTNAKSVPKNSFSSFGLVSCDSCEQLVKFISMTMQNPEVVRNITNVLKSVCYGLSSSDNMRNKVANVGQQFYVKCIHPKQ